MQGMRAYALREGFDDLIEIQDDVSGTTPMRERTGGARLYRMIDRREVAAVIFYTVDRVTRDEDLIEINTLRRDCRNAGIELHYAHDGGRADLSTWGGVIDTLKAAGAAEERKKIIERNMRGRMAKAQAGRWVGEGTPPYGYRKIGKLKDAYLVIDEDRAATVRRIYALYLGTPERDPMPIGRIQEVLNTEDIPRPMGGRYWCKRTINVILGQMAYIGRFQYRGIEIPLPELAIIAPGIFEAVQRRREYNRHNFKRNRVHDYLLTSRIRCTCGRAMSGRAKHGGYLYYVCSSMFLPPHVRTCHEPHVKADYIDAQVWDWLTGLLSDDAQIAAGIDALTERAGRDAEPKQARADELADAIDRTERKIKRLVAAYGDADDHELQALRDEARQAGRALSSLQAERAALLAEIAAAAPAQDQRADMLRTVAALREELQRPDIDIDTRRYVLEQLGVRVSIVKRDDTDYVAEVVCEIGAGLWSVKSTHPETALPARRARRCDTRPAPRTRGDLSM
jgi:DNA invertase Pin-like site-specific DNA recombinase